MDGRPSAESALNAFKVFVLLIAPPLVDLALPITPAGALAGVAERDGSVGAQTGVLRSRSNLMPRRIGSAPGFKGSEVLVDVFRRCQ